MRETAHHKRPEQRDGVKRVFPDRRATRCGEPDQRRGPNRRLALRRMTGVTVFASDGSEIKTCRLRDISLDGAFLETKNFALAEGTKLDLVLRICREGKTIACPLPAEVIRVEEDGVALMFGSLDEHLHNILLKIVNRQGNGEVTGDRRLGLRRAAGVKVLAYDGVEMKKCRLRDISLDGAFLETKNFALTKGTNLEVVLKICSGGKATHCRLPAVVIRAEEDGAAVMFADLDEQADNTLLKIVKPFKQKPNAKVQAIRSNDQPFPRRV